ncbi:unnamed protein product, partial [Staurois parvus]
PSPASVLLHSPSWTAPSPASVLLHSPSWTAPSPASVLLHSQLQRIPFLAAPPPPPLIVSCPPCRGTMSSQGVLDSCGDSVLCYNKGCAQRFLITNNPADACLFHPGYPIFHDALKGWSCCRKRTTDFSEFLAIQGCTKGPHSNEKPLEALKPDISGNKPASDGSAPEIIVRGPKSAERC